MDQLTAIVQAINSYLWGVTGLIPLLVGVGIFYTFKLKFVQIRKFGQAMRFTFRGLSLHGERAGKEGMTSFQSLATAVAAQVGTGNIAGAATAIAMGGPGAIFWMWIAAFFGMATIFAEAVLAQLFKTKDDKGHVTGGPAYYITNGLHCRPLAIFFSISIIIALGFIGNMVQSNSIAVAFQNAFGIPSLYTGLFVACFAAFIFFGGLGRIASTTEKIVPVMAFLYILGSLIVILSNYEQIIPAFKMIFVGAFNPQAVTGGIVGSIAIAMQMGIARGIFSNEAGLGSAPIAAAAAKTKEPVRQGLVTMTGTFIDTIIICTLTGLTIIVSGQWLGDTNGAELTQNAFAVTYGGFAPILLTVSLALFAFTTILGWNYYGERCWEYLFGTKSILFYRVLFLVILASAAFLKLESIWALADIVNGLMAIPNLIALLGLTGVIVAETKKYFEHLEIRDAKLKAYKARRIGKR